MDSITVHIESQVLNDAKEHLRLATQERSYCNYWSTIEASKEVTFTGCLNVLPVRSRLPPLSQDAFQLKHGMA